MRTTPNYFKFRRWLNWRMKDNPLGDGHFHADDIYQNNLLNENEIIPATYVLSYGPSMLEYAQKFFRERAYSSKIPTFHCNLTDIDNYDPNSFEKDDSIPDFSTLEKMAALFPDNGRNADISFYVTPMDTLQKRPLRDQKYVKSICTAAPLWFGTLYNMIYTKWMIHSEKWGYYIAHWVEFYHSDAKDFYPFESNKWI